MEKKDLTLYEFEQLMKLQMQQKSELDFYSKAISFLYNIPEADVDKLKINDFKAKANEIATLINKKPKKSAPSEVLINGEKYKVCKDVSKLTFGQYIDMQIVLDKIKESGDNVSYMHELVSCLLLDKNGDYLANLELAKDLSYYEAYPIFVFFSTYNDILPIILKIYTMKMTKKLKKQNKKLKKYLLK